jgi:hypothetical protein
MYTFWHFQSESSIEQESKFHYRLWGRKKETEVGSCAIKLSRRDVQTDRFNWF